MSITAAERFKAWAFPGVISILSAIIWQDVQEIKSDTKTLLAQSMIDKTRIDNLEREVFGKDVISFNMPEKKPQEIPKPVLTEFIAVKPEELDSPTKKEPVFKPSIV